MMQEELGGAILFAPPRVSRRITLTFEDGGFSFQEIRIALVVRPACLTQFASSLSARGCMRCISHACGVQKFVGGLVFKTLFLVQLVPDTFHAWIRSQPRQDFLSFGGVLF